MDLNRTINYYLALPHARAARLAQWCQNLNGLVFNCLYPTISRDFEWYDLLETIEDKSEMLFQSI